MFSWFLKLLGIDEDRPAPSGNSLLNASPTQANTPAEKPSEPAAKPKAVPAEKKAAKKKPATQSLNDAYPGLKVNIIKILSDAGFDSKNAIDKAKDKDLLALKGIGQATINKLRK